MAEPSTVKYDDGSIKTLDWREHIRLRPGMYIGKLGDGSAADDGIYILVKEIIDNSIDEFNMGHGKTIEVTVTDERVEIRDFGRGIPLGKVIDCVSRINTGGKYDSGAFQKSVGLNGVGTKAVNALSHYFKVRSIRDGEVKEAVFQKGDIVDDQPIKATKEKNGTHILFEPDRTVFRNFRFIPEFLDELIHNYAFLNAGLSINYNGRRFFSTHGLLDLLKHKTSEDAIRYPIVHLRGTDLEIAMTHGDSYGEEYYSFVNGQFTTQGGTHLAAFREAVVKTVREFFKRDFESTDVRQAIIGSIAVRIQEPVFESQTKTKLGSLTTEPNGGITLRSWINDFVKNELDNFLHKNPAVADAMLKRITQSERERKDIAGIRKLANERAKKANLHNKKLRDCRVHLVDEKSDNRYETTLFITEGDSASGSLTKSRDVQTQAVFSLRGKPLNCFGETKKVVYENEEFNLLQHALDIEEGLENLRYSRVVVATDADVDGMHIRLLLLTFFLQFFPDLVRNGHLYILETPLFRVRNKKETRYCYTDDERQAAIKALGPKPEITRFKGLGEISPDEFGKFIGPDIKLSPVILHGDTAIKQLLSYYMGKNTPDRQRFIIDNLKIEKDVVDELIKPIIEEAA